MEAIRLANQGKTDYLIHRNITTFRVVMMFSFPVAESRYGVSIS